VAEKDKGGKVKLADPALADPAYIAGKKAERMEAEKELADKDNLNSRIKAGAADALQFVSREFKGGRYTSDTAKLDMDINALKSKVQRMKDQGYKKGGKVKSASARADGIAQRGKTKGMMK